MPAKQEGNPDEPPPVDLDEVQVWDLLAAFDRLMKEVAPRKRYHEVTYDDTPIPTCLPSARAFFCIARSPL